MSDRNYEKLNELVARLSSESDKDKSIDIALEIAGEVMRIIMPNDERGKAWAGSLKFGEDALNETIPVSSFPNQKVETWFEKHPYFGGERLALKHFCLENVPFESKFYGLNRSASKARVTAGVMLTANWEDSELTKHPNYKVGIDFFLSADTNALFVVVSNQGKLRVLELSGHLSNTQIEIMKKIDGAGGFDGVGDLEPQRTIHRTLWDAFALKEVNKKFYEGISVHFLELLQHLVSSAGGERNENDAKQFANRLLGRLLFIWFLRKKGIINEDPEIGYFVCEGINADEYYHIHLKRLFFDTLNTPVDDRTMLFSKIDKKTPYLNGGLFEPHENDWINDTISFPQSWFSTLYNHFDLFNFTTDESSPEYEQVAIDPEMLGRVFENLLATQRTETGEQARKANGAFYTPREIVSYMCRESLRQYLYAALGNDAWKEGVDKLLDMPDSEFQIKHSDAKKELFGRGNVANIVPRVLAALDNLKMLDPACGSGAFPMGMLQLLLKTIDRLGGCDDPLACKLRILKNNIFGVDIEPMAVELSRLRVWLSIVVDEKNTKNIKPLPNLDFKFVCANSLIPLAEKQDTHISSGKKKSEFMLRDSIDETEFVTRYTMFDGINEKTEDTLAGIRKKYFETTEAVKKIALRDSYFKLRDTLDMETESAGSKRLMQIRNWDPFNASSPAPFYDNDVMFGMENGFDVVIGNPPYIHFEHIKKQSQNLYKPLNYKTYEARGDIYALFYERGMGILKDKGLLCYITSNKWMRAAYGQSLRGFFAAQTNPIKLIDFAGQQIFDATVDTNILLLSKTENIADTEATTIKDSEGIDNLSVYIKQNGTQSYFGGDGSWTILSPIEQRIKEKIEAVGVPLKDWDIQINYGIKTGCNEAFIISGEKKNELIIKDPRSAEIIRPILRGRDIKRYAYEFNDQWIIATFPALHYDIDDFPAIKEHLIKAEWRKGLPEKDGFKHIKEDGFGQLKLEQTGDEHILDGICFNSRKKTGNKWFETQDQISYWDDFSKQKILWAELARSGNAFAYDPNDFIVLNTAYILVLNDDSPKTYQYLTAFLNSKMMLFYLNMISSKFDETGWRWLKQFVELLPIPITIDDRIVNLFKEANTILGGGINVDNLEKEIDAHVCRCYGLDEEEIRYMADISFRK